MLKKVSDKILANGGKRITKGAKANLNAQGKNASNKLRGSLKSQVKESNLEFFMMDYGPSVDVGRNGWSKKGNLDRDSLFYTGSNLSPAPTVEKIKKWMPTKGIRASNGMTVESIAIAITKSVSKEGVKASLFFTDAYNKEMQTLPDKFAEGYADDIEVEINLKINK